MRTVLLIVVLGATASAGAGQQAPPSGAALVFDVVSIRRNQQAETDRASLRRRQERDNHDHPLACSQHL